MTFVVDVRPKVRRFFGVVLLLVFLWFGFDWANTPRYPIDRPIASTVMGWVYLLAGFAAAYAMIRNKKDWIANQAALGCYLIQFFLSAAYVNHPYYDQFPGRYADWEILLSICGVPVIFAIDIFVEWLFKRNPDWDYEII